MHRSPSSCCCIKKLPLFIPFPSSHWTNCRSEICLTCICACSFRFGNIAFKSVPEIYAAIFMKIKYLKKKIINFIFKLKYIMFLIIKKKIFKILFLIWCENSELNILPFLQGYGSGSIFESCLNIQNIPLKYHFLQYLLTIKKKC